MLCPEPATAYRAEPFNPEIMAIKLVVFDMAGTTVADNDNVAETLQAALRGFNCRVSIDEVNKVMGLPKPVAIKALLQQRGEAPDNTLVTDVYALFEEMMIHYYRTNDMVNEQDGASEVFMRLKENGIKIGIDTGFSRKVADAIINRLGWNERNLVDVSVTSDEVENGRPHPDMIFKAMSLMDITNASEVAKVGDTISDILEGSAAGCKYVIGIAGKANTAAELATGAHTHTITNIREVADIVLQ